MVSARRARPDDAPHLAELRSRAVGQPSSASHPPEVTRWVGADLLDVLSGTDPRVVVAEHGDKLVGWAVVYVRGQPLAVVFLEPTASSAAESVLVDEAHAVAASTGLRSLPVHVY